MSRPTANRRARVAALALMLATGSALVPAATALAAVTNPASGGARVSADLAGTSRFTPITGPAIAESALSELSQGSTTILNIPSGFRFNTHSGSLAVGENVCSECNTAAGNCNAYPRRESDSHTLFFYI